MVPRAKFRVLRVYDNDDRRVVVKEGSRKECALFAQSRRRGIYEAAEYTYIVERA